MEIPKARLDAGLVPNPIGVNILDRGLAEGQPAGKPDILDSETCRWHIAGMTGLPARHPIELIAESLVSGATA